MQKIDHLWSNSPFIGLTTYTNAFGMRPLTSYPSKPNLERTRDSIKPNPFFYDMKTSYNVFYLIRLLLKILVIFVRI